METKRYLEINSLAELKEMELEEFGSFLINGDYDYNSEGILFRLNVDGYKLTFIVPLTLEFIAKQLIQYEIIKDEEIKDIRSEQSKETIFSFYNNPYYEKIVNRGIVIDFRNTIIKDIENQLKIFKYKVY